MGLWGPLSAATGEVNVLQDVAAGDPVSAYVDFNITTISARYPLAGTALRILSGDPGENRRARSHLAGQLGSSFADLGDSITSVGAATDGLVDSVRIDVEGLGQFRRDLRAIGGPPLVRELREVLKHAAEIAARQASVLAPRKTGRLARSYRPFTRGNTAGVRSRLPYAGVIEFGGTISPKGTPIDIRRYEPVTRAVEQRADAVEAELAAGFDDLARAHGFR